MQNADVHNVHTDISTLIVLVWKQHYFIYISSSNILKKKVKILILAFYSAGSFICFILHLLFSSYIISPLEKHSETHRLKIVVAIEVAFLICELYLVSGYLIQACVPQRYYRYE